MNVLPSSVERSLAEAGFSPTELLILKRLLEENALTLREIASKTGKSTGVLDQAMKKLYTKGIVSREVINDTAKYTLTSLDSVLQWMEKDAEQKRDLLVRRYQNFESFISSLKFDRSRPDIQYYEGTESLQQAYLKLLKEGKELLQYVPVLCAIEDDPLRDFHVQYFRERRRRGIFSRVIAHNTPLGRRYQSRDPFEYRQTLLVPEDLFPFRFEKVIAGDVIACFNHLEKRACLITYPELAALERGAFEMIWKSHGKPVTGFVPSAAPSEVSTDRVPLSTRTLSGLREFFLSRTSIVTFAVFAIASAVITFGLYRYTRDLQFQRMRETVKSIAATGAFQFDPKDIDALQVEEDWKKPEWGKVVNQLKQIRENNEDIQFVYLIRKKKDDPTKMEFISDSHSLNPYVNKDEDPTNNVDTDNNGIIDLVDLLQWPGQEYPTAPKEAWDGYSGPTANEDFYEDWWGKFVTGYAPIKHVNGEVAGVLAVDIKARKLDELTANVFTPGLYFVLIFLGFVIIRLTAFNRSLFSELVHVFALKKILVTLVICTLSALAITYGIYLHTLNVMKKEIGIRLMSIAATAAPEFDPKDLEQLHWAKDMKTDAYQRVFRKLNEVRNQNKDIQWAYIHRRTEQIDVLEFVADADSNYFLPFWNDLNHDGLEQPEEYNVAPGIRYDLTNLPSVEKEGFHRPIAEIDFYSVQWGTYLSGYAPIKDATGRSVAVLGLDMDVSDVLKLTNQKFSLWFWFFGIFSSLIVFRLLLWPRA